MDLFRLRQQGTSDRANAALQHLNTGMRRNPAPPSPQKMAMSKALEGTLPLISVTARFLTEVLGSRSSYQGKQPMAVDAAL